jgi:hypothetical protein
VIQFIGNERVDTDRYHCWAFEEYMVISCHTCRDADDLPLTLLRMSRNVTLRTALIMVMNHEASSHKAE